MRPDRAGWWVRKGLDGKRKLFLCVFISGQLHALEEPDAVDLIVMWGKKRLHIVDDMSPDGWLGQVIDTEGNKL